MMATDTADDEGSAAGGGAAVVSGICQVGTITDSSGRAATHTTDTVRIQCRTAADCARNSAVAASAAAATSDAFTAMSSVKIIGRLPSVPGRRFRQYDRAP